MNWHHIHAFHLWTGAITLVAIISLYMARIFLQDALSEPIEGKDGKIASSKRLVVFVFMLVVGFCEIFHTVKRQEFDIRHLCLILLTMLLYSSIAQVPQIIQALTIFFNRGQTVERSVATDAPLINSSPQTN